MKAMTAIILGAVSLGLLASEVVTRYRNAPRPHPLPPIGIPAVGAADASKCYYDTNSNLARLEPPDGTFFFGFSPNWTTGQLPSDIQARLGFSPPVFNSFITISLSGFQSDIIEWNCQQVGQLGGILELTAMPKLRAQDIPDNFYSTFAIFLRQMNAKYGVPILLRFMHEMNGNWMLYGIQPIAFGVAWRRMAVELRLQTNLTAMVWSPNLGSGYPNQATLLPGSDPAEFAALDTNGDGRLTKLDDPYSPFYPGDDYVDWIGISVYDYGRLTDGSTELATEDIFYNPTSASSFYDARSSFYPTYVVNKRKPFMLSETGASVDSNLATQLTKLVRTPSTPQQELAIKRAWWTAILSSSVLAAPGTKLSQLKLAVWFEESKVESAYQDPSVQIFRDYTVTVDSTIAASLASDLRAIGSRITTPGRFKFACNGSFSIL